MREGEDAGEERRRNGVEDPNTCEEVSRTRKTLQRGKEDAKGRWLRVVDWRFWGGGGGSTAAGALQCAMGEVVPRCGEVLFSTIELSLRVLGC